MTYGLTDRLRTGLIWTVPDIFRGGMTGGPKNKPRRGMIKIHI